jgi:hypothetical protein
LETRNWYGDSIMLSRAGSRSSKSTETSCGARWRSRPGRGAHGARSACAIGAADLSSGSRDQRPRCEREEEGDGGDWGDEGKAAPEPRGSGATVTGRGRAPGHHCSLLTDRHTVRTRICGSGNGRGDGRPSPQLLCLDCDTNPRTKILNERGTFKGRPVFFSGWRRRRSSPRATTARSAPRHADALARLRRFARCFWSWSQARSRRAPTSPTLQSPARSRRCCARPTAAATSMRLAPAGSSISRSRAGAFSDLWRPYRCSRCPPPCSCTLRLCAACAAAQAPLGRRRTFRTLGCQTSGKRRPLRPSATSVSPALAPVPRRLLSPVKRQG